MACLEPHSEVSLRRVQTWGHAFIGVEGGVPRVLRVHSLLVNLKHKSKKAWEGKVGSLKWVSYLGRPGPSKRGTS